MTDAAPAFGVDAPAYVAIRAMMYLSAMLVIGSCAFVLLIATRVSHLSGSYLDLSAVVPSTRLLARWATVVLAFAMVARLLAQGFMLGEGESLVIQPLLESTLWGWGWLAGAAGTLLIAGGLIFGCGRRAAWRVTAFGTIVLALSFSLTGHATSASKPVLFVMLDSLHAMAAGGWLGTLLVVATIGLWTVRMLPEERRARAASELIDSFSSFALLCAGTLAITGIIAAWSHLPTIAALWQTQYGQALFRKLVAISLTALVGAFNWLVVKPRLAKPETVSLLRTSAIVELTIGVVVVILTAILVGTSPPDSDDAMPASTSRTTPVTLASASAHTPPFRRCRPALARTVCRFYFPANHNPGDSMTSSTTVTPPAAGDRAPDFTADSTSGQQVTLSSFVGKKRVLLAFFPLAFTSTCTTELCDFSADFDQFTGKDVEVVPISVDSVPTLEEFKAKYGMRVDLVSDFKREISRAYGVLLADKFFSARAYFLVGLDGRIEWAHVEAHPGLKRTNDEIMEQIAAVPA